MPSSSRLPVQSILYDEKFNCRGPVFPKDVEGLAKLIETQGLINPVTVRPLSPNRRERPNPMPYEHQLIAGHRRFIATTQILGWTHLDCWVVDCDDEEAHRINLLENLGRQDLTPSQELNAIKAMYSNRLPTDAEIAAALGKSKIWVKRRLAIMKLHESARKCFDDGRLGAFDLEVLIACPLDEQQALVNQLLAAKARNQSTASIAAGRGRQRRQRTRGDIQDMMTRLAEERKYPTAARALAWAAGTISDEELLDEQV